jgi:hypothetical protein
VFGAVATAAAFSVLDAAVFARRASAPSSTASDVVTLASASRSR